MERLLKDYSYYLRIERKMSPNTVGAYCSDVRDFLEQCRIPAAQAGPEDIIRYFESRSNLLSKRSQARILSSMRSFYDWMILEGEVSRNPCDKVEAPKLGKYLPAVLSVEEVSAILESVPDKGEMSLRDRAILEVLYGCGLRVSELCSLRISNIYMEDTFLRIIGKGNKERLVPFAPVTGEAISNWLGVRPAAAAPQWDDFTFLNRFGKPLSRISVFSLVKKYALAAGVTKEISPHTFRHSFATHLIENGADLRVVQEMLGHENILTTEIYTHIDSRTWQASILQHHPRRLKRID
ncbi:MAG: tyrosine recombinase XerD [Bacteroidales bacterium]|nr:tyrosine recombinase XerD [Candidatus Cryptobacteroides fimicaballi]